MKKHIQYSFVVILFCLAGIGLVQKSHAQLGFAAGYNYSKLSDITLSGGESSFENATGWHVEMWFDLPVGDLALRPGLRYMSAGKIFEFANDFNPTLRDDFDVSIFEIPIDLRFRFNMEIATPFIAVGPIFRFPSSGRDEVGDMSNASVAGGIGFGLEFDMGLVRLYPELKYTFGISQFVGKEMTIAGIPFSAEDTTLLNGVLLRLGVGL